MAKEKRTRLGVWIILGLLCFSLIGFGSTSLTGRTTSVATVGEKEVSIDAYYRELQGTIRAVSQNFGLSLTPEQVQAFGLPQSQLNEMINRRVLENEATRLGLSAGDALVRDRLVLDPSFTGISGEFDREVYRDSVRALGQTEAEYEDGLRDELASTLLRTALATGVTDQTAAADVVLMSAAQTRDITWSTLTADVLTDGLAPATDEELTAFYESNAAAYTLPETKRISYAALTPAMLLDTIEIDEATLQDLYAQRDADYNRPERRLVERLVYFDANDAQAAFDRIASGEIDFDALVEERGLTLDDVDLGDVAETDLGAAGAGVFAAATGDVVGPLDSNLGPALFRINAILAAENITFEQARDELRRELAADRARRQIASSFETLNDLLAGGATVQDLASQTDLELGSFDWTADSIDGMAAYPEVREAAATAQIGDYPEVISLADGGVISLSVDEVIAPQLQPLEDVRAQVEADIEASRLQAAVITYADSLAATITADSDFAALGLTAIDDDGLRSRTFIDRTPAGFIEEVFASDEGAVFVMPYNGGAVLVRLDAINTPDVTSPDLEADRAAQITRLTNSVTDDILTIAQRELRRATEVTIDQNAVNAVLTNLQ